MKRFRCWMRGAREVVQVTDKDVQWLRGSEMASVKVLTAADHSTGLSVVVDAAGLIYDLGHDEEVSLRYCDADFEQVVDVGGKVLMPGLVDCHTHPVFAGDRVHEFAMKLAGASYMQVHDAGGGIHFTVRKTRDASEDELYRSFADLAQKMLMSGTTLAEAKSGYGLDTECELKMLRAINRVAAASPLEISPTFCGAHAIPQGSSAEAATAHVLSDQLPAVRRAMTAEALRVENMDVFCEQGVFSVDQTRRMLEAGAQLGLRANFHGDELSDSASAELAAAVGATAVCHLEHASDAGIAAMAAADVVAVLLPTTALTLRLQPPPARAMIDSGVIVALGSDFNPSLSDGERLAAMAPISDAHCFAMPLVMYLACVLLRMSMEEALVAATLHAAAALGRGRSHGALCVGRVADMLIINAPSWQHLVYQLGSHQTLIETVLKGGRVVFSQAQQ